MLQLGHRRTRLGALTLFILMVGGLSGVAHAGPKVAMLDVFGSPGVRLQAGVLGMLVVDQLKEAGATPIPRSTLIWHVEGIAGKGPRYALLVERSKMGLLLKSAGADFLVYGVLKRRGTRLAAQLHLWKAGSAGEAKTVKGFAQHGGLNPLAHTLAKGLAKAMGLTPPPGPPAQSSASLLPYVGANHAQLARKRRKAVAAVAVAAAAPVVVHEGAFSAAWFKGTAEHRVLALVAAGDYAGAQKEGLEALSTARSVKQKNAIASALALAYAQGAKPKKAARAFKLIQGRPRAVARLAMACLAHQRKNSAKRDRLLRQLLVTEDGYLPALAIIATLPAGTMSKELLKEAFERVQQKKEAIAAPIRSAISLATAIRAKETGIDEGQALLQIRPALLTAAQRQALKPLAHRAALNGWLSGHRLQAELALIKGALPAAERELAQARDKQGDDLRTNLLDARLQSEQGKKEIALQRYGVAIADGSAETRLEFAEVLDTAGQSGKAKAIRIELAESEALSLALKMADDLELDRKVGSTSVKLSGKDDKALAEQLYSVLQSFGPIKAGAIEALVVGELHPQPLAGLWPYRADKQMVRDVIVKLLNEMTIDSKLSIDPVKELEATTLSSLTIRHKAKGALLYELRAGLTGRLSIRLVFFHLGPRKAYSNQISVNGRDVGAVALNHSFVVVASVLAFALVLWIIFVVIRGTGTIKVAVTLDPAARQPTMSVTISRSAKAPRMKNPQKYTADLKAAGAKTRRYSADMVPAVSNFPRIPRGKFFVHLMGTFLKDGTLRTIAESSEPVYVRRNGTSLVDFDLEPKSIDLGVEFFDGPSPAAGVKVWIDGDKGSEKLTDLSGRATLQVPRRKRCFVVFRLGQFESRRPVQFDDTRDRQLQINIERERQISDAGHGFEWEGTIDQASAGYAEQMDIAAEGRSMSGASALELDLSARGGSSGSPGGQLGVSGATAPSGAAAISDHVDQGFAGAGLSLEGDLELATGPIGAVPTGPAVGPSGTRAFDGAAQLSATVASAPRAKAKNSPGRASAPAAPSPLDRYQDRVELGRGAMGVVFRARDTVLERSVAVKLIGEELAQHPKALEMFVQEAKALAALNHPNVVTVFDQGKDGDKVFMVMELVEGDTLEDRISAQGRLSLIEGLELCDQVCAGLGYAHGRKIIHRDIKPENIMISKDGIAKIADFGLARVMREISIQRTEVKGTPLYMSPEQIRGTDIDFRADIYSFGCTLYEMFSGRPPFIDGEILYHHLHTDPQRLAEVNLSEGTVQQITHIPDELDELIIRCIAKEKEDRPESVEVIRAAIKPLIHRYG